MIPASYLYKDAYKQHWGEDFGRRSGEAPWQAHPDAGLWEKPSLWRSIAGLAMRLFASSNGPAANETEATDRRPALPA